MRETIGLIYFLLKCTLFMGGSAMYLLLGILIIGFATLTFFVLAIPIVILLFFNINIFKLVDSVYNIMSQNFENLVLEITNSRLILYLESCERDTFELISKFSKKSNNTNIKFEINDTEDSSKLKIKPELDNANKRQKKSKIASNTSLEIEALEVQEIRKKISISSNQNSTKDELDSKKVVILKPKRKKVIVGKKKWEEIYKRRIEIGKIGELIVLEREKIKLLSNKLPHLAMKIEHSSETLGDGLGYDIQSFDLQERIIYIEVKTTIGKASNSINFTNNEFEVAQKLNEKYRLYRVYELDENEFSAKIEIYEGFENINNNFNFEYSGIKANKKILNSN